MMLTFEPLTGRLSALIRAVPGLQSPAELNRPSKRKVFAGKVWGRQPSPSQSSQEQLGGGQL
jgi:hypothetical protein